MTNFWIPNVYSHFKGPTQFVKKQYLIYKMVSVIRLQDKQQDRGYLHIHVIVYMYIRFSEVFFNLCVNTTVG